MDEFFEKIKREKLIKKLEIMKKAELIDYVMEVIDGSRERSSKSIELINELTFANQRIEELEEELRTVKKNDSGAGRKEKFATEQIEQILESRRKGKSIRTIASEFSCSAGLVHKIIKTKEEEI